MVMFLGTQLPGLTYAQVKANKDLADALVAPGLDVLARTDAAVAFIRIVAPDLDLDGATPGAIQFAALNLYRATFDRPEADAPVQTPNP